jgi:hypothetical protein
LLSVGINNENIKKWTESNQLLAKYLGLDFHAEKKMNGWIRQIIKESKYRDLLVQHIIVKKKLDKLKKIRNYQCTQVPPMDTDL